MSDWYSARVCDVCEQISVGTKYSKELVQDHGNIKVLDQSQADIFGWHNNSADIYASPESPVFTFANHTCSMRWMDEPFSVIQNVFPIRGIPGKTDTRFLYYASGASVVQDGYKGHFPQFRESIIQIPPLPEQKKIAEILSGTDLLIQGIKAKVSKLKEVRNALIQNLHLESSEKWVALSEISDFVTSGSRGWSQYYSDTGSKFVRIGNLRRDSIDLDPAPNKWKLVAPPSGAEGERTKLEEGDILISITADLGICCIYSAALGEAYINQHISLVRIGSEHISYSRQIAYYICSEHCQEQIRSMNDSGAKAGLNLDSIRRIRVPLLHGGDNNRIARSIDALQSAISGNLLRLRHLAHEKSSIASDLLSGRKRVSV